MNWLMLLIMVVQVVSPGGKKERAGPNVGKAHDGVHTTNEVGMGPPGIDFCRHAHHATEVRRARTSRLEQEQRRTQVIICTAQKHQLTCDTVTLGCDRKMTTSGTPKIAFSIIKPLARSKLDGPLHHMVRG